MDFIKNVFKSSKECPLKAFFLASKDSPDFALKTALVNLSKLEDEVSNDGDLLFCALEDSVFSSLQATYFEEMFSSLKNNQEYAMDLVKQYAESKNSRDLLVYEQAQTHVDYIIKGGSCSGCDQCDHHKDVDDLRPYYENGDLNFIIKLYLGMQTINLAMEALLFTHIPKYPELIPLLDRARIAEFRTFIFSYTEQSFEEMLES